MAELTVTIGPAAPPVVVSKPMPGTAANPFNSPTATVPELEFDEEELDEEELEDELPDEELLLDDELVDDELVDDEVLELDVLLPDEELLVEELPKPEDEPDELEVDDIEESPPHPVIPATQNRHNMKYWIFINKAPQASALASTGF